MSQSKRFSHSFKPIVKIKPDTPCRLKSHYSGALRELTGILDYLASLDPERFVYAGVPALMARCKRFSTGKNKETYRRRSIEYALAQLRREHVIGERESRVRDGVGREGFRVETHDKLTASQNGRCFWDGFLSESAEGCAEASAEGCADASAEGCAEATSPQADD